MIDPLVSIIIPTYNRRELLQDAVASCLAQTYTNIEIVIIDDGSNDGTTDMVAARLLGDWARKVVYHRKPNGGTSSAKNVGIKQARGEYIQFLDSDDILRPEKISRQMDAVQVAGGAVDCCVCTGRIGDKDTGWDKARQIGELCSDVATYIRRQCERSVHIMHTEAPLWRRDFLTTNKGWREDLIVAEEWEYYIRLLAKQPRLTTVPDELFFVRSHKGAQLSDDFWRLSHSFSFYRAIRSVQELLEATPFWVPQARAGLLLRACTTYINLLRCCSASTLREYEKWLLKLARAVPDYKVVLSIRLRKTFGRKLFLALFNMQNIKTRSSL